MIISINLASIVKNKYIIENFKLFNVESYFKSVYNNLDCFVISNICLKIGYSFHLPYASYIRILYYIGSKYSVRYDWVLVF